MTCAVDSGTNTRKRQKQCAKCPWKVGVDPRTIPNGYSEARHKALRRTIAEDESLRPTPAMACHDTPIGAERACVGWLHNQLGVGNNIALRLAVIVGQVDGDYELAGPQHATFDSTLPR